MDYIKRKTLSIYLWCAIFIWPLIHYTISPANQAILTFIAFMCDFVVTLNKNRLMVYSEYKLIKSIKNISLRRKLKLTTVSNYKSTLKIISHKYIGDSQLIKIKYKWGITEWLYFDIQKNI